MNLMQASIIWHSQKRKISELKPAPYNPRELTEKQAQDLATSLELFNLAEPIVINQNNTIVGGHQRINILKAKYGDNGTEVDVRVPNRLLTQDEEVELNLRLNKNLGQWNFDALANFDEELLKDVGFESQELDKIFQLDLPNEDDVPEVRKTNIKLGDMFQLDEHRLLCGDATKKEDVEKLMQGEKADMVFTDPPYNVGYQGGGSYATHRTPRREKIIGDELSQNDFYEFLKLTCQNLINNCKGAIYICMGSKELHTLRKAFEEMGGHWQSYIIWVKNHFTISRADYQQDYEPILYGWRNGITNHYFLDDRGKGNVWEDLTKVKTEKDGEYTIISFQGFKVRLRGKIESGEVIRHKQKIDIWRHDKPSVSAEHPTMKPIALCQEAIINSSKKDSIVLDLFLGSGSTLIAAEKTNRICYGLELDEHYCDIILKRYEDYTNTKPIKIV